MWPFYRKRESFAGRYTMIHDDKFKFALLSSLGRSTSELIGPCWPYELDEQISCTAATRSPTAPQSYPFWNTTQYLSDILSSVVRSQHNLHVEEKSKLPGEGEVKSSSI